MVSSMAQRDELRPVQEMVEEEIDHLRSRLQQVRGRMGSAEARRAHPRSRCAAPVHPLAQVNTAASTDTAVNCDQQQ